LPAGALLLDNWTLQCAGSLLEQGLTGRSASELVLTTDGRRFRYLRRSEDIVNVRSLFQALDSVVFGQTLVVDQDSAGTWADVTAFLPLLKRGVILAHPFQPIRAHWVPARERFVTELCVCPAMRALHRRNVARYAASGETADAFFAQLIWGGAGMMARAHAMGIPYLAHPLRDAWFQRVGRLFGPPSAQQRLQAFATEKRVQVLKRADQTGFLARLSLPPVAALAVQEATSLDDVVPVALQLRREYAPLREWLGEFQAAMDAGQPADLLAREKVLQSVGRNIESMCSAFPVGDTTLQIGTSWLKMSLKTGDPINTLRNQFGVRAMINRLLLAPAGREVVRKLAGLCGEKRSRRGLDFEREFLRESSRP
jgi:hypothetical protein